MASLGKFYTTRPVPAIARVEIRADNLDRSATTTSKLLGTIRMIAGHLECDPPSEAMEELVEDLRYDYAFGREWRRLTDAELLAHLPLRPMGYTWAEAYDADGHPVDVSGIRV
jgi:hypothetical protein